MNIEENCRYSREHEWARMEGDLVCVGITDYAQQELGDVVFVDLPATGTAVEKGKSFATVESVKAVSDIYSPVDGVIERVNAELSDSPDKVNVEPYQAGWMVCIKPKDGAQVQELMSASEYRQFVEEVSK